MTDTLTIGETPVKIAQLPELAEQLRREGEDKIAMNVETAQSIHLRHLTVNARERDAIEQALKAIDNKHAPESPARFADRP